MRTMSFLALFVAALSSAACSRKEPSKAVEPVVAAPAPSPAAPRPEGACRVAGPVVTVDKGVRPDTGVTFSTLADGRLAVGFAAVQGSPRVAVLAADGSASVVEVDSSALPDLAVKPAPKASRTVHRVVPWAGAGLAVSAFVDYMETRADGTRVVRCGASNGEPLAMFDGASAFDRTDAEGSESLPKTELRDCRSVVAPKPFALVSEAAIADDGVENRWSVHGASSESPLEPFVVRKVPAEKGHALPRGPQVDRYGFSAASAIPLGEAGWLVSSRHNGHLVVAKLDDGFRLSGDLSDNYYGAPVGRASLSLRDGRIVVAAALSGKSDVVAAAMPLEAKLAKLGTLALDGAAESGAERAGATVVALQSSETLLGFVAGKGSARRGRFVVLDASLKPRGEAVQPFGEAEVHAVDVAALDANKLVVTAVVTQAGAGQVVQSAVLDCSAR